MRSLSINKNIQASTITDFSESILSDNCELRIPNTLKERGALGIEGLLIQLITTWIRNSSPSILHSHATTQDSFEDICSQAYGIYAITVADRVLDQSRNQIKKSTALKPAAQSLSLVREGDFRNSFKGHYTAIMSICYPGTESELTNPFYTDEKIASPLRFQSVIRKAIKSILPQGLYKQLNQDFLNSVASMTRELFSNTHLYARRDPNGNLLTKNIRAVTLTFHRVSKKNLSSVFFQSSLKAILSSSEWSHDKDYVPILEITVVDGGPGFASSWLGREPESISIEQEKEAVVACFRKHGTSSELPSKGFGLTNVMKEVRKLKGRLQLTTGRVFLEKVFFQGEGALDFEIDDTHEMDSPLSGSSLTISLPFL